MINGKKIGAYWFGDWRNRVEDVPLRWDSYPYNVLKVGYPERMPLVGWIEGHTQDYMDNAKRVLSNRGIDYIAFCWFWDAQTKVNPNRYSFANFMTSQVRGLEFCIAFDTATAEIPVITVADVDDIADGMGAAFDHPDYLRIDGRPVVYMIKMSDIETRVAKVAGLTHFQFLQRLRERSGHNIFFVACIDVHSHWVWRAKEASYQAVSLYNTKKIQQKVVTDPVLPPPTSYVELTDVYRTEWAWLLKNLSGLKLIAPMTLGWDARPIGGTRVGVGTTDEVEQHMKQAATFIMSSPNVIGGVLYAVNENWEGAVVLPTQLNGRAILGAVQRGLSYWPLS